MIKIDAAYLFDLGSRLSAIASIPDDDATIKSVMLHVLDAIPALHELLGQSIFREDLRLVLKPADELIKTLELYDINLVNFEKVDENVSEWQIRAIKDKYRAFEIVLQAALRSSQMYYVSSKGGFNTLHLTDFGSFLFPDSLGRKVPEAIVDLIEATRCIAFELPTAAGFHLHRANEAVLRVYWDCVTNGAKRPRNGNMGAYLRKLKELQVGKPEILTYLDGIREFHRNPLMHPDQSLSSTDDAINLLAAIRCSIGYMLDTIPESLSLPK